MPLFYSCLLQTLLGLAARTDAVNVKGQTPLDLCITDAAREMLGANATKADFVRQVRPAPNSLYGKLHSYNHGDSGAEGA